jgi:hypothetical protein
VIHDPIPPATDRNDIEQLRFFESVLKEPLPIRPMPPVNEIEAIATSLHAESLGLQTPSMPSLRP